MTIDLAIKAMQVEIEKAGQDVALAVNGKGGGLATADYYQGRLIGLDRALKVLQHLADDEAAHATAAR